MNHLCSDYHMSLLEMELAVETPEILCLPFDSGLRQAVDDFIFKENRIDYLSSEEQLASDQYFGSLTLGEGFSAGELVAWDVYRQRSN